MTKRSILIDTGSPDDKVLVISRATKVRIKKPLFHLDELPDGTWRVIYSTGLMDDMTVLSTIDITGLDTANLKALDGCRVHWRGIKHEFGEERVLYRIMSVKMKPDTPRFFHFEGIVDSTENRIIYSSDLLADPKQLKGLRIIRED